MNTTNRKSTKPRTERWSKSTLALADCYGPAFRARLSDEKLDEIEAALVAIFAEY